MFGRVRGGFKYKLRFKKVSGGFYNQLNIAGVYCIKNIVNDKRYVGCAVNMYKRRYDHYYNLNNNQHINRHLQNAWNKGLTKATDQRLLKLTGRPKKI